MATKVKPETDGIQVNPVTGAFIVVTGVEDEGLLEFLSNINNLMEQVQGIQGHVVQEAMRRADERGASVIYGKTHNFVIETKNETDWSKMAPVLEFLTPEEKKEAFKPEHTITVPAVAEHQELIAPKWAVKGTIMKLLRRHGDEAVAKADEATFPGASKGKLVEAG